MRPFLLALVAVAFSSVAPALHAQGADTTALVLRDEAADLAIRAHESRTRVAHFVTMFSGPSKARIVSRLERGSRYEPMIRAKLREGGLPEDLYYLALVESGFDTHAYSRAAAVGMWQFMTSTAREMGLRVDPWVDERRDPVRATGAAVRFIRELRDQFGSLYLATAAYNGGPTRVARGMKRFANEVSEADSVDAFFVLADKDFLKPETRDYVPQLIAAALVAKEPSRFGMELRSLPPLVYDSVRVPGGTPLSAIALAAGVRTKDISDLNPHFLRGMTPPRTPWMVRIPEGMSAPFDSSLAALSPKLRVATSVVVTKKGDRPETVARRNGIGAAALKQFNPAVKLLKSGRYPVGQVLTVPSADVAAAVLHVPVAKQKSPVAKKRSGGLQVKKKKKTKKA